MLKLKQMIYFGLLGLAILTTLPVFAAKKCCKRGPQGPVGPSGPIIIPAYASFYSVGLQTIPSSEAVTFDLVALGNGAVIAGPASPSGTEFTVQVAGVYDLSFGFYVSTIEYDEIALMQLYINGIPQTNGTTQDLLGYDNLSLLANLNSGDVLTLTLVGDETANIVVGTAETDRVGAYINFVKISDL